MDTGGPSEGPKFDDGPGRAEPILGWGFVSLDHLFQHLRCLDTMQIGTARSGRERQSKTDEVMRRIPVTV